MPTNEPLQSLSREWMLKSLGPRYSYQFTWLGRPIIQYPQDMVAVQELVFAIQPDLIIETGIAHGGSLMLSASLLELNALCGGPQNAQVVGIDIDIRAHNRAAMEAHPLYQRGRIRMLEGSSIDPVMISRVHDLAHECNRVLVLLDSNHTHDHVLAELDAYAPLVSVGSYCVVFDTIVEFTDEDAYPDRPWGPGNNPMTATHTWLANHGEFVIDEDMDARLLLSVAPRGYLKRIR